MSDLVKRLRDQHARGVKYYGLEISIITETADRIEQLEQLVERATPTVQEAARVLLDAFGEDKYGRWEFPVSSLNAAIDAHGLALTDISALGFRCSPQDMLAKSFRAALRTLAEEPGHE